MRTSELLVVVVIAFPLAIFLSYVGQTIEVQSTHYLRYGVLFMYHIWTLSSVLNRALLLSWDHPEHVPVLPHAGMQSGYKGLCQTLAL